MIFDRRRSILGGLTIWLAAATGNARAQTAEARATHALLDRYIRAWESMDASKIVSCMTADLTFIGPNVKADSREGYEASTRRFLRLVRAVRMRSLTVGSDSAMIAWDFQCVPPAGVSSVAELVRVRGGLIAYDELFFDTAPFVALARPQAEKQP